MYLSREVALDILYDETDKYQIIEDKYVENTRWSINSRLVIQDLETKKYYAAYHSKGATEYQDEEPWEDDNEVLFTEVFPEERTTIIYKALSTLR